MKNRQKMLSMAKRRNRDRLRELKKRKARIVREAQMGLGTRRFKTPDPIISENPRLRPARKRQVGSVRKFFGNLFRRKQI